MKKIMLLPVLAVLCLQACKKDESNNQDPEPQAVAKPADYFFPMKVGNYWVYEKLNTYDNSSTIDTIIIKGSQTINGRTYYEFNRLDAHFLTETIWPATVADSAGFIINMSGAVVLINDGTRDTIAQQDIYDIKTVIRSGISDTIVNVQAGSFNCLEMVTDAYYLNDDSPTGENPRHLNEYWHKGVGLIKRGAIYAISPYPIIITLKSYHLEP